MKTPDAEHFQKSIRDIIIRDFIQLSEEMTVDDALAIIRKQRRHNSQTLVYFYVTNSEEKLTGVLQTRLLLTAQPDEKIKTLMIPRVIAIPESATVLDACEFFVLHKFLAFPVVDADRRILGTVDINLFNEEVLGISKNEQNDDLFQAIGFHISQLRHASPLRVFRYRFPWLLITIVAGTCAAFLTQMHEKTLSQTIEIAFFLTLVLALGESVCVQSLALALETLRMRTPTLRWFLNACRREILSAIPLAISIGIIVFGVVFLIAHAAWPAFAISVSISLSIIAACLLGISIPTLLNVAKLDLTIAAGPITLAVTDVTTLLIYLTLTSMLL